MKKPIFYSTKELFEKYPTISERGWTVEDLETWVKQDIIIGRFADDSPSQVEIEKESIEAFLTYHNNHLLDRNRRVEEGVDVAREKPSGSGS
ncbi:MAG: hypothetical protein MK105_02395 [Crocinitomicaceae bacterium]|nr:hypothetical protein [Crocinitomicaceae bacterium]